MGNLDFKKKKNVLGACQLQNGLLFKTFFVYLPKSTAELQSSFFKALFPTTCPVALLNKQTINGI